MLLRRNKVAKQMKRTDSFWGSIPLNPPVLYTYSSSSVSEEGLRGKKGVPLYKSRLYPKKAQSSWQDVLWYIHRTGQSPFLK